MNFFQKITALPFLLQQPLDSPCTWDRSWDPADLAVRHSLPGIWSTLGPTAQPRIRRDLDNDRIYRWTVSSVGESPEKERITLESTETHPKGGILEDVRTLGSTQSNSLEGRCYKIDNIIQFQSFCPTHSSLALRQFNYYPLKHCAVIESRDGQVEGYPVSNEAKITWYWSLRFWLAFVMISSRE